MVSGVDGQLTTDVAEKNGVIVKTSPNLPGAIKLLMNNSVSGEYPKRVFSPNPSKV